LEHPHRLGLAGFFFACLLHALGEFFFLFADFFGAFGEFDVAALDGDEAGVVEFGDVRLLEGVVHASALFGRDVAHRDVVLPRGYLPGEFADVDRFVGAFEVVDREPPALVPEHVEERAGRRLGPCARVGFGRLSL